MAKYSGMVTYATQTETVPGVWEDVTTPYFMRGDVIRRSSQLQNDDKVNNDISLNHRVSLVGDAFAFENYYNIKHINIDGQEWKVTSVEVQHPRIIVTVGGVWNGK